MPLIWAFGGDREIVEIYSSLFPLPPLFSPDLANKACPFDLHTCRHEAKPRACNKGKAFFMVNAPYPPSFGLVGLL